MLYKAMWGLETHCLVAVRMGSSQSNHLALWELNSF